MHHPEQSMRQTAPVNEKDFHGGDHGHRSRHVQIGDAKCRKKQDERKEVEQKFFHAVWRVRCAYCV